MEENTRVTTLTIILQTNVIINFDIFFNEYPITNDYGGIFCIVSKKNVKGIHPKKENPRSFKNSMTCIMKLDKVLNIKILKNKQGECNKIQFIGFKSIQQMKECLKYLFDEMNTLNCISLYDKPCSYIVEMKNRTFRLGFKINRQVLSDLFNEKNGVCSLYEGNPRVLIYFKVNHEFKHRLFLNDNEEELIQIEKQRQNTFVVFHSGSVIMISTCEQEIQDHYNFFMNLVNENIDILKVE